MLIIIKDCKIIHIHSEYTFRHGDFFVNVLCCNQWLWNNTYSVSTYICQWLWNNTYSVSTYIYLCFRYVGLFYGCFVLYICWRMFVLLCLVVTILYQHNCIYKKTFLFSANFPLEGSVSVIILESLLKEFNASFDLISFYCCFMWMYDWYIRILLCRI